VRAGRGPAGVQARHAPNRRSTGTLNAAGIRLAGEALVACARRPGQPPSPGRQDRSQRPRL